MRVLLVDVNYRNSSTGKIVHDLYEQLKDRGNEAVILFGRGIAGDSKDVIKIASVVEVLFHAAMTRLTGLTGIFSYFATRKMIAEIRKFKPDVVHLHELHGYYINIEKVIRFFVDTKIPVVWTFHCEFMYTGKCGYAYDCEKWKTECRKCPQVKEYPSSLFFDFTNYMYLVKKTYMQDLDLLKIVTPSRWLASRVKLSFLSNKDISVIHNGIDTENTFFPRDYSGLLRKHGLDGKKVILAVAPNVMEERKGGRWVLELAKRFSDDFCFILIGVEDGAFHFPDNVIALNRTANQVSLAEYYSLADIFVICSKRENFPTTCLESLACGTPIIGFDEGGTAETAPPGYGYFVSYGDLAGLKNLVDGFFDNSVEFKSPSDCRAYAVKNYGKESMFESYQSAYQKALAIKESAI